MVTLPLLLLLLLEPALAQQREFAGSAVCKGCHAAISETQSASAHARSLRRPPDHALASAFAGPAQSADWAFGAGAQAVTFVSRDGPDYLEQFLTFYPRLKRFAITPGHKPGDAPGVRYPVFSPNAAILRCFQCHSTGAISVRDGAIQPGEPGVVCESCHGPGAAHAKAPAKANIHNPRRYTPAQLNTACGSCHRMPAASGDDTDFSNPWNARHQPLFLARSKCFTVSGKLDCLTCHDPHSGAARSTCSTCHAKPRHTRAVSGTCESCHMPPVVPLEGLSFANHWIAVYRPGAPLTPIAVASEPKARPRK